MNIQTQELNPPIQQLKVSKSKDLKKKLLPYLFILPSFVGVLLFMLGPAVMVLGISTLNWNLLSPPKFIGLQNYMKIFHDPTALHSILTTAYYVVLNIPAQTIFAILLALLLNRRLPGIGVFRALFVMPWLAMPVALSVVWQWILDPNNGFLNTFLHEFGIPKLGWLTTKQLAMPAVAMVHVWQWTGYNMLFFLAGLQSIPRHLYEAAELDGAGSVRKFFIITLPLLRPTMLFVLITSVIGSFQIFDLVYVMTQGGPGMSTNVYNFYIFQQGFQFFHMGYAASLSVVLFIIILLVTLVQLKYFNKRTTYDLG